MTKTVLREELITIIMKGAARGKGNGTVGPERAAQILDALVASDTAPEWDACVAGQAVLRRVVTIYRAMP